MDYVREVHAFYNELEINPLSSSAIALWHVLLHMSTRFGSKGKFSVPVGTLSLKSGLSDRSISNARNELKTKGYIDFTSRGGSKAAMYQLRQLSASIADNCSDNASDFTSDNSSDFGSGNGSALKDLKDIHSSSASSAGAYESFYAAHTRVFGFECNPFQTQKLVAYIEQDGMSEDVVIRAIERAALASKGYRFNLITKILDDYFRAGVRTLGAAKALDESFEAAKGASASQGAGYRPFDLLDQVVEEERKRGAIGHLGVV
ncbi:DnaD domain protein [Paenibacillus sp. YYML68]|uniref:DnaD domain protein n=1 Tax=Paenibacillus sp. YYML68 TaxID=2909250 RepID=UPI00248F9618|nr:DnaD domain protein [Paenibacillus sp. YYML68]